MENNAHGLLSESRILYSQSFIDYQRIDAVHKSTLVEMERSPAHYRWAVDHPKEATESMALGKAFHTLVLEPELFKQQYYVAAEKVRRATKKWDELEVEAAGRTILKPDEFSELNAMASAIAAHPEARRCLDACKLHETSLSWTDLSTGEKCKMRADALSLPDNVVIDLKTTVDASPLGFERAIIAYKYHWQAAMYCDGLEAYAKKPFTFVFIAVESEAPWGVGVYILGAEMLENGRRGYKAALQKVAECKAKNSWPCYSDICLELSGPEWMKGNK